MKSALSSGGHALALGVLGAFFALPAPVHAAALPHAFKAEAPMISNTGVHRAGEYVYQDYVYDDHGANTDGLNRTDAPFGAGYEPGNPLDPFNPGSSGGQIRHAGEYMYPGAGGAYDNVADLIDFRVAPTADALVYEFRLGALKEADDAVVGMCVDEDRDAATGLAQWPLGANVKDDLGCDRLYTVFGTGAKVTDGAGNTRDLPAEDVRADTDANTIQLRVPHAVADPGRATWRYTVGSGLWDGAGQKWTAVTPSPSRPTMLSGGDSTGQSPQLYDLLSNQNETNSYWREEIQANDLKDQSLGSHHVDVDFGRLADRADDPAPQPTGVVQRLYVAQHRVDPGEGIVVNNEPTRNYTYRGDYQPYTVVVPSTFYQQLAANPGKRFRFDQCLHPLNGNHNVEVYYQQVASLPNTTPTPTVDGGPQSRLNFSEFEQRVDRQNVVYACVNGRSESVGYTGGIGTVDAKEVQREVEKHYPTDPDLNILHGISLGSIGTWYMAMLDPDRYAGTVNAIFTPGFSRSSPRLRNLLNVPLYMAIGSGDEFGQAGFADGISDEMETLGNEYVYEQLLTREHELSIEHEILPFTERLIYPRVRKTNPARVRYQEDPARYPSAIPTDGAVYWVGGMKPRADDKPADVDVTSLARADELPTVRTTFTTLYKNDRLGRQSRFRGQFNMSRAEFDRYFRPEEFEAGWVKVADPGNLITETTLKPPKVANGFELTSANLGEAAFDTARMKVDPGRTVTGSVKGDGPLALTLRGSFRSGTTATYDGRSIAVSPVPGGIRLALDGSSAARTLVIEPGPAAGPQASRQEPGQQPVPQPGPSTDRPSTGQAGGASDCDPTAGFRSVSVRRRGGGLRFGLSRSVSAAASVDVFQVSRGRTISGERLVARFTARRGGFGWAGRDRRGKRLRDGYYFARFTIPLARGKDVRRITLRRAGGRFSTRPSFHARESCGTLRAFKLSRPVFGGTQNRPLGISYRLGEQAQVSVVVLRGSKVVQRFPAGTRTGGRTFRLRLTRAARRRGDYRVRITVRQGARSQTATLTARRL